MREIVSITTVGNTSISLLIQTATMHTHKFFTKYPEQWAHLLTEIQTVLQQTIHADE